MDLLTEFMDILIERECGKRLRIDKGTDSAYTF